MSGQLVRIDVGPGSAYSGAIAWASELFAGEPRKGKPLVPYLSHLFSVAALVMQDGGTEVEVVAAILHDAMEDKHVSAAKIADTVGGATGARVARIVFGCSDGIDEDGQYVDSQGHRVKERDASTWRDRKEAYLKHLRTDADASVLRVSAADKLDNARDVVADLHEHQSAAMKVFNAPPKDQLWWYTELATAFHERLQASSLPQRLCTTVQEMTTLVDVAEATALWESHHAEKRL